VQHVFARRICGGHIEAAPQPYQHSLANCNGKNAISFTAIQSLTPAEYAAVRFNDLA